MSNRRTQIASLRRVANASIAALFPGGRRLFRVLADVDGHLYPHEAVFLYWLAREAPGNGAVVEIGSFRGRSTLCMAAGLKQRGEGVVFAIDPHIRRTERELRENVTRFGADNYVEVIAGPSVSVSVAWKKPVRLLFVDGNHREESVQADVNAWQPHVEAGGFIALHDSTCLSNFAGPRIVAGRLRLESSVYESAGTIGSISWFRKRGGDVKWQPRQHGRDFLDRLLAMRRVNSRKA